MKHEELFAGSVRGAMHIDKDLPRQDAEGTFVSDKYKIFVTADGHGSKAYFRSDEGSKMAVDIAIKNLAAFAEAIENCKEKANEDSENILEEILNPTKNERRVRKVIMAIISQWKERVKQAVNEKPFTEEELSKCGPAADDYRKGLHIEHVYGTTLLAGLLTEDYLLLIHQGDGRIVLFDSEGNASEPVPWDERCVENISTSMCDTDAIQACRYIVIPVKEKTPIAAFLCCDGVEDSFYNMEATYGYCRKLLNLCCETSVKEMEAKLPELLDTLSKEGSRDDVTITGFVNVEAVRPFVEEFKRIDKQIDLEARLAYVESRLTSMTRKHQYLKEQYEDAVVEKDKKDSIITKCQEEIEHIKTKLFDWKLKKEQAEKQVEVAEKEASEAADIVLKAKQEYDEYHERYLAFEEEKDALEAQVKELLDCDEDGKESVTDSEYSSGDTVSDEETTQTDISLADAISTNITAIEENDEESSVVETDSDEE